MKKTAPKDKISQDDFSNNAEKLGYLFVVVVAFVIGLSLGLTPQSREKTAEIRNSFSESVQGVIGSLNPNSSDDVDDTVDFTMFWTVWNTVASQYVNKDISHKDMFYGAIKGMVSALGDPVTTFLTPDETSSYEQGNRGAFEGIGAELGYRDDSIVVVTPLEGSPAKAAGLLSGDIIVAVDGKSLSGLAVTDAVTMIRGKSGTKVKLTIVRGNANATQDITITRGKITVSSITYKGVNDKGIAVLDVDRFTEASLFEWQQGWDKAIDEIKADNPKALIIDLRGNPGGYFSASIHAASEFLTLGDVVVQQQDRDGDKLQYKVERVGELQRIPVIVLVNEGSASASEILAGALQKNGRAKVLGTKTFGKGTAQDVIDYPDGSSLHITVYKWLLPDGKWINPDDPIVPDIKVDMTDEDFKAGRDPQMDKAVETLSK